MARTRAISSGPVEFTDGNGKQISLPLTSIFFDGTAVKAEGDLYTANQAIADPWLAHLAAVGLLLPDAQPPAKTAMVIAAARAGSAGNFIQITFSNFGGTDPNNPKFDTAVAETNTYKKLTPATVQIILGATAAAGSQPGLVFVPGPAPTDLPKAGSYPLVVTNPNTFAAVDIPKNTGSGKAFTAQAEADGPDGAQTTVTISDVDTATSSFTLVAAWNKTASQITASQVGSSFPYLITVTAPSGGSLSAPAAGTITLSGGSDASSAAPASAAVPG
ncbi:MAG TPA: hypothetical protein VG675_07625 [Bryobacteraceae bacterium]|nr:hypothetical protein [Bryobacteraceae bacterium]